MIDTLAAHTFDAYRNAAVSVSGAHAAEVPSLTRRSGCAGKEANFIGAGHFRNYLLSHGSPKMLELSIGGGGDDPPQGRLSSPAIKRADN